MHILHKKLIDRLNKDIKMNKVKQNYLFTGEEGIGKKTLAKRFAKALLCVSNEEVPCHICKNCKMFEAGTNVDYITIEDEDKNILIDTIRNITSQISMRPVNAKRKVVFIPSCQRMTEQAQNSLLKTFEAPPSYATIIMTTKDKNLLLQTIRSRVFEYKLSKEKKSIIKEIIKTDDDFCIHYGNGNIGRTKMCFEKEFIENKKYAIKILKNVLCNKNDLTKEDIKDIIDEDTSKIFQIILEILKDSIAFILGAQNILHTNVLDDIVEIADKSSYDIIIERFKQTKKAMDAYENNTNKKIILENYLL